MVILIPLSTASISSPNHLIGEKSPYLLQHAYNPVDWYPWSPEAFEKAKKEEKPIFLSIGYSTCHWCHVMAHESFEDVEVANILNAHFISIKVDREERPDIDKIYMDVCQAMTGRGGWPLTIIMTPEKKPFFAATYIPKQGRFGMAGLLELLPTIHDYWRTKRNEILESAEKIVQALQEASLKVPGEQLGKETVALAYTQLVKQFDPKDGGFGGAPKFPTPHNLLFLLRYWQRTGAKRALHMVELTLQKMRRGGIFDQVGFGFHRYSTDYFWLVPHFEKMIYDQALISLAYTEAYQATRKEEYKRTVSEILSYVLREMTHPQGGLYSAEDADSVDKYGKLVEGKFYLWRDSEIRELFDEAMAKFIIKIFNIKKGGNFLEQATQQRTGENILHLTKSITELATEFKLSEEELLHRIEQVRIKLYAVRAKRPPPNKDDKILASWNGLMIAALAKAARILNDPSYSQTAEKAVNFILTHMVRSDKRLLHRFRDGEAAILANLDDYAFFIWGLLELYETTFNTTYLQKAIDLTEELRLHFWDSKYGGFFYTPIDGEPLIFRRKDLHDGAIPSGNSVAMLNLLKLEKITGNSEYSELAFQLSRAFANQIKNLPMAFTQFMIALEFAIGPSYQIVIAGDTTANDTNSLITTLRSHYFPNKIVILNPTNDPSSLISQIAPYVQNHFKLNEKATAYICVNNFCQNPISNPAEMLKQLQNKSNLPSSPI
ncbi:MAG: thioredoxin domain-containing protein [Candidatus Helarchaeota archaeon]